MPQLPPTRGFFVGSSVSMARHQPSLTGGARLLDRRSADYHFGLPGRGEAQRSTGVFRPPVYLCEVILSSRQRRAMPTESSAFAVFH